MDAKQKSRYSSVMSELAGADMKEEKPPKKLMEMRIRKAKNKGHIIEHHHNPPHDMEEHTTANMQELMSHMQEHMGDADEAQEGQEEAAENE